MAKRGRKSQAEQSLKVVEGKFKADTSPPIDLTDRQSVIWRNVIKSEPTGHFDTEALRALLSDYCRHRESAEKLSKVINEFRSDWLKSEDGGKRYDKLLKMRDLETKAVMRCATKLRMTNQSRYTPQAAATAARSHSNAPKPWEL